VRCTCWLPEYDEFFFFLPCRLRKVPSTQPSATQRRCCQVRVSRSRQLRRRVANNFLPGGKQLVIVVREVFLGEWTITREVNRRPFRLTSKK
jgi:hypothetical protein